jgi:UbiD family decarboxylase
VAGFRDLRGFLDALRARGDLVEIDAPVDPRLEMAEVHRRVIAAGGPALLFRNPWGAAFPAVTNLFGTRERVELAFGDEPGEVVRRAARLPETLMPPSLGALWGERDLFRSLARVGTKRVSGAPVLGVRRWEPGLSRLPVLTTWAEDGGPFLTLPLVSTEPPDGEGGPNLGMYRCQIHDDATTGMHWQIGKGGGFHHAVAEARGEALPVNVTLGGPPAMILAAIAPLPEHVPELLLASLLQGSKLELADNPAGPVPLVANAEFVLTGEVPPGERRPEGPFGDHYGYYSLRHDYPVFRVKALFHRSDAVYPATVVGKPRQEDFFIGDFLQELLSPIFPVVMPAVTDLWSYGETGYHSLAAAVVKQRYKREAMASAFRILGEGQLSLTKFLLVLDTPRDLRDFPAVLEHVLERADFRTDLYLFGNLSMDTLDYTGPKVNEGSKGVLLGVGDPIRDLPRAFTGEPPADVRDVRVFCGGCLVVETAGAAEDANAASRVASHPAFADWPLVVVVDDAAAATRSPARFLWTTFTRFEPAADVTARSTALVRAHVSYTAPVVIDARLKPGFPAELFCDPDTARTVTDRWREYFPTGDIEMGDSDVGHLDEGASG